MSMSSVPCSSSILLFAGLVDILWEYPPARVECQGVCGIGTPEFESGHPEVAAGLRGRGDPDVLELPGFVERAQAHLAWSQAEIDRLQRGYPMTVYTHADRSGCSIVRQRHVMPASGSRKCRWTPLGADAHALATVNMKDAVVHGLLGRSIDGQVGVVVVRFIAIGENDHQGTAERSYVHFHGKAPVIRS